MRPLLFFAGIITVIYVIAEWFGGHIQFSIEGYTGNGMYDIINFFDSHLISRGLFLNIIYLLTLLTGIGFMWIGIIGKRKTGGK